MGEEGHMELDLSKEEKNRRQRTVSISTVIDHADGKQQEVRSRKSSTLRDFLTMLALSFHAVFEGMAIGLEEHKEDVWELFAGVATHKYVISFCFGIELISSTTRLTLYTLYIVTFSIITAVGGAIGIGISQAQSQEPGYQMTTAVLQGMYVLTHMCTEYMLNNTI